MNEHLKLLNGLIGLASSIAGWPNPLQELGYVLYWVGPSYLVSNGKKSNPDLVFVSKSLNHCLIFECKSGISVDDKQLGALAATTKDNLIQSAHVSFRDPKTAKFDIVIVCLSDKSQSLAKVFDNGNYDFPLLVIDYAMGYAQLERAILNAQTVSGILERGISFNKDFWPLGFIPYDETSELAEIANVIIPEIVSLIEFGEPHFNIANIIINTCPVEAKLHPSEETRLTQKIRAVLYLASKSEFGGLLKPIPGGGQYQDKWIVNESIKVGGTEKKVGVRSLQKRTSQFVSRLKKGSAFTGFKEELESWQIEMEL